MGEDSLIERHLRGAVQDGVALGVQMAIDCLVAAKPMVAEENQTWASAIATLNLYKADYERRAADE